MASQVRPGEVFVSSRHTVEAGHIRRFAEALEDPNPLWHDAAYAADHGYRGVPAPPTFSEAFNPLNGMARLPVDLGMPHDFSAGNRYVNVHPLIAGDVVDVEVSLLRVVEDTRGDGVSRFVRVEYQRDVVRADGVLVASTIWTHAHFEGEPARTSTRAFRAPDDWARVADGALIVDRVGLAKWACAINDLHPIHFDLPYMRDVMGFRDVVADGWRGAGLIARTISDWAGPVALLHELDIRYLGFVYPGDRLLAEVWMTTDQVGTTDRRTPVETTLTNQEGVVVARGSAAVTRRLDEPTPERPRR